MREVSGGSRILEKLKKEDFYKKYGSYDNYREYRSKKKKICAWLKNWVIHRSESVSKRWLRNWAYQGRYKSKMWLFYWVSHRSESKTKQWLQSWVCVNNCCKSKK